MSCFVRYENVKILYNSAVRSVYHINAAYLNLLNNT